MLKSGIPHKQICEELGVPPHKIEAVVRKNPDLRRSRPKTSEVTKLKIIEMLKDGIKHNVISEKLNVNVSVVSSIGIKSGLRRQTTITPELRSQIISDLKTDMEYLEIAEKHSVCFGTVCNIARDNDLQRRDVSDKIKEQVIAQIKEGKTHTEIAENLPIVSRTVGKIGIENGLRRLTMTKVTEDIRADIIEMVIEGKNRSEIKEKHGLGYTAIGRIIRENDLQKFKKLSRSQIEQILKHLKTNLSYENIADKFDVSGGCVAKIAKRNGIVRYTPPVITSDMFDEDGNQILQECTACNEIKDMTEFNKNRTLKNGHDSTCRICRDKQIKSKKIQCVCKNPECGKTYIFHNRSRKLCPECYSEFEFGFTKKDFIDACLRNNDDNLGLIYLIKCWDEDEWFYKIGITSRSIRERFEHCGDSYTRLMPYNYKCLWAFRGDPETIWDIELDYKRFTENIRYQPDLWPTESRETFKCAKNSPALVKPKGV